MGVTDLCFSLLQEMGPFSPEVDEPQDCENMREERCRWGGETFQIRGLIRNVLE